jgi:hypothetical protein
MGPGIRKWVDFGVQVVLIRLSLVILHCYSALLLVG